MTGRGAEVRERLRTEAADPNTSADVELRGIVGQGDYREVVEHAPPGVFDSRSWGYWNLICGRRPASAGADCFQLIRRSRCGCATRLQRGA